jgi:deoxyribonuclease (pyrimidine dimer)
VARINIIPVEELMDQYLIAEYREIIMVPASLARTLSSKAGLDYKKIPSSYALNKGHVYFFYDKGFYLLQRYKLLVIEMKKRGFKPDSNRKYPIKIFKDNGLYNDWTPTAHAYIVIRDRIREKLKMKPN